MTRISSSLLQPALLGSADPLAADLLGRLRSGIGAPASKSTRPFPRLEALRVYRRKAAQGDRNRVRTDGYPELLAALSEAPDGEVAFADAVYLVFTDRSRAHCVGVLRKVRLPLTP